MEILYSMKPHKAVRMTENSKIFLPKLLGSNSIDFYSMSISDTGKVVQCRVQEQEHYWKSIGRLSSSTQHPQTTVEKII